MYTNINCTPLIFAGTEDNCKTVDYSKHDQPRTGRFLMHSASTITNSIHLVPALHHQPCNGRAPQQDADNSIFV